MTSRGAQVLLLLVAAAAWGLGANALRPEPLPLRGRLEPLPPLEAGATLPSIHPLSARAAWENGAFFVDVRDPAEYMAGHVSGALSLPADDFDAHYFDVVAGLDSDIPLVVYGAGPDSFRVRRVAQELTDRGHAGVDVVIAGLDSLYAAGLDAGFGEDMP